MPAMEPARQTWSPRMTNPRNRFTFPHERLEVYRLAVDVARRVRAARWPRRTAHIRDQAVRAAESVVLNIAEGVGRGPGDARTNHHSIAFASAAECLAALDVVDLSDKEPIEASLRRVGAMLRSMTR